MDGQLLGVKLNLTYVTRGTKAIKMISSIQRGGICI